MKRYICLLLLLSTFVFCDQVCVFDGSKAILINLKTNNRIELEVNQSSTSLHMAAGSKHFAIQSSKNFVTFINVEDPKQPFIKNVLITGEGEPKSIVFGDDKFAIITFSLFAPGSLAIVDTKNNYAIKTIENIGSRPVNINATNGCFGIVVDGLPDSLDAGVTIVNSGTGKIDKKIVTNSRFPRDLVFGNENLVVVHQVVTKNPSLIKNVKDKPTIKVLHEIIAEWTLADFSLAFGNGLFALPSERDNMITLIDAKTEITNIHFLSIPANDIVFSNNFFAISDVSHSTIEIVEADLSSTKIHRINLKGEVNQVVATNNGFAVITDTFDGGNLELIDTNSMTSRVVTKFSREPKRIAFVD